MPFLEDDHVLPLLLMSVAAKNLSSYFKLIKILCFNPANAVKIMHGLLTMLLLNNKVDGDDNDNNNGNLK